MVDAPAIGFVKEHGFDGEVEITGGIIRTFVGWNKSIRPYDVDTRLPIMFYSFGINHRSFSNVDDPENDKNEYSYYLNDSIPLESNKYYSYSLDEFIDYSLDRESFMEGRPDISLNINGHVNTINSNSIQEIYIYQVD